MRARTARTLLTALLLLAQPAAAAQALEPVAPSSPPTGERADAILLVAQPVAPVAVAGEETVGVEFRVTDQDDAGGVASLPGLGDLRLRGVARSLPADGGGRIVQVLISEIERAGRLAPLAGFGSDWAVGENDDLVLSLGETVEISGDRQSLVDALDALDDADSGAVDDDAGETLNVRTSGQESTKGAAGGSDGGSGGAGGGAATGYTQPAPVKTEADPVIETRETKTGCSPRIDLALRIAIDQIRDETYTDGNLTGTGDCYDSYHEGDKYPLERDYSACPVKIELGSLTATGRFRWFYRNGDGSRIDVASGGAACVDDATRTYSITEDHSACKVAVDYTALTATPQARLVYEGGDGVSVEVRACRPSTSRAPVPLVLNTGVCPQPESGRQMAAHTYTLDGVLHQPDVCAPSGTTIEARTGYADCGIRIDHALGVAFRQVRDMTVQDGETTKQSECYDSYAAADRFRLERDYGACKVEVDLASRTATGRFRLRYTDAGGQTHVARECSADPDRAFAIFEAHDCAIAHEGGMAILRSRLVYQTRDGRRHEARECAPSEDPARAPIAMAFNAAVCGNPDGSAAAAAFQERGRYEYELDGITRTHGACRDTGRLMEYRADHDACRIEIDEAAETVFKRFRIETVVDGAVTATSPCMRSATEPGNRPLERDHAACADIVDMAAMRKTYRFRYKYEDPHSHHTVTLACRDGTTHALTEDHEACDIAVDTEAGEAVPQSRLVYTGPGGTVREARACQASETRDAIDLVRDTERCPIRAGNEDGVFQEKAAWTYRIGDTVHTASGCEATGTSYEYRTDYDGCEIRVDHQLRAAIRQARRQTFKDGAKTAESACRDSTRLADRFAFERSYSACAVATDLTALTATTYFKWIYTDHRGNQRTAAGAPGANGQDCVADAERTYAITEDHESCTDHIDYNEMEVTPQARLVYRTQDGRDHEVRGCEASASREPVDLVKRPDLCSKEHDLAAGKSHQLAKHIYTIGGLAYQADTCTKTGVAYSHERHYGDCEPVVDRANSLVTRQYQVRIRVDGAVEYVVPSCTADADSARIPIKTTTDGCNDPEFWIHDIAAGISYGLHRLYYIKAGGNVRVYVTENCVASGETYRHDVETVGYQHHDDEKFSYALSKVSISTGDGVHVIRESDVLPGTPKIDYILDRTVDLPPAEPKPGDRTYEGCNAFGRTDRTEFRTRPDGSEFSSVIGDGERSGPTYACTWVIGAWTLKSSTTGRDGARVCPYEYKLMGDTTETRYSGNPTRIGTYQGGRTLRREDGHTVSTEAGTGTHTIVGSPGYKNYRCRTYPDEASLPDPMTNPTVLNRWHVALGWK